MADQLGWSFGADGFPDLGPDLLSPNSFDNSAIDDIDGKLFICYFILTFALIILLCAACFYQGAGSFQYQFRVHDILVVM